MKKISKVWYLVAAIAVLGVVTYFLSKSDTKESITFDTEAVGKRNIQNSITATGTIEPVTSERTSHCGVGQNQPHLGAQPSQSNARKRTSAS